MKLLHFFIQISRWGKHHKKAARLIIVVCHLLLTILALGWGILLFQDSIILSKDVFTIAMLLFMIAVILYPSNVKRFTINNYLHQKLCDLVLVASTFFMLLQIGNDFSNPNSVSLSPFQNTVQASTLPKPTVENLHHSRPTTSKKLSWKEKIQLKKSLIKKYFNAEKEFTDAEKIGYAILGVLGATILLFLVLMLACNLSCSGAEGLATMVAIVGTGGIIFLLALLFKHLFAKKKTTNTIASL